MLHFVKQFKRKKTTFENFFVQKTNAEYTVTDNAQEAFPEKPCGSAVKAVVPCLLKKNFALFKTHTYGKRATDKGIFEKRPVFNLRYVPFSARRKTQLHFEGFNSKNRASNGN